MATDLAGLLQAAALTDSVAVLGILERNAVTLDTLKDKFAQGRTTLLAYLKESGVRKLGDCQKITNALSRSERLASADVASSAMVRAMALKERGNEAFKSGDHKVAVQTYEDAIAASKEAMSKDQARREEAELLLISLYSNSAAALLKLERWAEAVTNTTSALELDGQHAKALFRRGVAHTHLQKWSAAKQDLVQSIRIDPKSKEARAALTTMEAEKLAAQEAAKAKFREGFQKEIEVDDAKYAEESEDAIIEAWRCECDRLRTELGRCVVSIGDEKWEREQMDDDEESKPDYKGFQLAPITLAEFKRQRKAKAAAKALEVTSGAASPREVLEAHAAEAQEQVVQLPSAEPDDRPECVTCGKRLEDWRFNCVCCDATVCDDCPMHVNPRDPGEGICDKCGPNAWRRL